MWYPYSGFLGFLNSKCFIFGRFETIKQKDKCPCVFNCGATLSSGSAHTWRLDHVPVRTKRLTTKFETR